MLKRLKYLKKGIKEISAKIFFYFKPVVISGDNTERQTVFWR
jgi:hypothetical protein